MTKTQLCLFLEKSDINHKWNTLLHNKQETASVYSDIPVTNINEQNISRFLLALLRMGNKASVPCCL